MKVHRLASNSSRRNAKLPGRVRKAVSAGSDGWGDAVAALLRMAPGLAYLQGPAMLGMTVRKLSMKASITLALCLFCLAGHAKVIDAPASVSSQNGVETDPAKPQTRN
jgi:hypothetical protein